MSREPSALRCAIAGCGGKTEVVYRGYSLCDLCLELVYALQAANPSIRMERVEDVVGDCNELAEAYPGSMGFGATCITPEEVLDARRRLGRRAMTVLYERAEARGFGHALEVPGA